MSANHWYYKNFTNIQNISLGSLHLCHPANHILETAVLPNWFWHRPCLDQSPLSSIPARSNEFVSGFNQTLVAGLAWKPPPHAAGARGGHHCSSVFFHSSRRQQLLLNSQPNNVSAVATLFHLSTATTQHNESQSWQLASSGY